MLSCVLYGDDMCTRCVRCTVDCMLSIGRVYIGDCWLLAAVASLTTNQSMLNQVIPPGQSFDNDYCGAYYSRFTLDLMNEANNSINVCIFIFSKLFAESCTCFVGYSSP